MSKKGVYVVTNPELGWDCVVAVYDASTCTEEDLEFMYDVDDYVISYKPFSEVEKPKEVDQTQIREIESDLKNPLLLCIVDTLEIIEDYKDILMSRVGKQLKKEDQHILGKIFKEFLKERNISDQGGEIVVVNGADYCYLGMLFPNELALELFDKTAWWEFETYLTNEKHIEIG